MRHFIYEANTPEEQAKSHPIFGKQLAEMAKQYPARYLISVKKHRVIRSLPQNKYYHMVWQIYASHTGHYPDELKHEFYDKIGFYELWTDKRGKTTKRYKSSADCDVAEMASLINQQAQWGREEFPEVIVPRKEDATYLQWLEVQNQYAQTFQG